MDWAVEAATPSPIFIQTSMGERLTVIAADQGVRLVKKTEIDKGKQNLFTFWKKFSKIANIDVYLGVVGFSASAHPGASKFPMS